VFSISRAFLDEFTKNQEILWFGFRIPINFFLAEIEGQSGSERTVKRGRKKKEITDDEETSPNLTALSEKPSAAPSDKKIAKNLDNIERSLFGNEIAVEKNPHDNAILPPPPSSLPQYETFSWFLNVVYQINLFS
jgi:hypothetical protein